MSFKFLNESIITNKPIKTDHELMIECITESVRVDVYQELFMESPDESKFKKFVEAIKKFFMKIWNFILKIFGKDDKTKSVADKCINDLDKETKDIKKKAKENFEKVDKAFEESSTNHEEKLDKAINETEQKSKNNSEVIKRKVDGYYSDEQGAISLDQAILVSLKKRISKRIPTFTDYILDLKYMIEMYCELVEIENPTDEVYTDFYDAMRESAVKKFDIDMSSKIEEIFKNVASDAKTDIQTVLKVLRSKNLLNIPHVIKLQNLLVYLQGYTTIINRGTERVTHEGIVRISLDQLNIINDSINSVSNELMKITQYLKNEN